MSLRAKLVSLPIARVSRFVAVVSIAAAAGHLVQMLAAHKPAVVQVAQDEVLPTHIVQLASGGSVEPLPTTTNPEPHLLALEKPSTLPECRADLVLEPRAAGLIAVALSAPCHATERVVLRQGGLAITGKLDVDGKMNVTLPAMSADGDVAVLFADGTRVEQKALVPDLMTLRRFGVQWQGADAFAVHALQDGADFDQPGDISHNNMGDAAAASGGFLTVLGDSDVENPLLAEIYTFPTDAAREPEIVLEAAVLPETCGHDLLGEVLTSQAGRMEATDLTLAMPDCSAVGDFLVLKNLASDTKIAAK